MQTDLPEKYGYCEIPKDLILYRGHNGYGNSDQLFFTTSYHRAVGFGKELQIWKTKKIIKVLFLVRHIDISGKGESSLPDLYYHVYTNETDKKLRDLDIKQDVKRRDPFARLLFSNFNISGWFTSIEDGATYFEICLFNKTEINESLEMISVLNTNYGDHYTESLKEINFFPIESFYTKSKKIITESLPLYEQGRDPFTIHSLRIKKLIAEYVIEGQSLDGLTHYYYDIRQRLKI